MAYSDGSLPHPTKGEQTVAVRESLARDGIVVNVGRANTPVQRRLLNARE